MQLSGDVLIAEPSAQPLEQGLLPQAQSGWLCSSDAVIAALQQGTDAAVEMAAIASHGFKNGQQPATVQAFRAAQPITPCLQGRLDGAAQRMLDQHQATDRWMALFRCGYQRRAAALVEFIGADEQLNTSAAQALEGSRFTGGCTHQGAEAIKQLGDGTDQHPIAAGDHTAAALQQWPAALGEGPHQPQLIGEVHFRLSGQLVEAWIRRESALPFRTGTLQNLLQKNESESWRSLNPTSVRGSDPSQMLAYSFA